MTYCVGIEVDHGLVFAAWSLPRAPRGPALAASGHAPPPRRSPAWQDPGDRPARR